MTNDERLNLRARQILDDTTLAPSERIKNANVLLAELRNTVKDNPTMLESILAEITDEAVRGQMRSVLTAA
jgi:hypothetical protein